MKKTLQCKVVVITIIAVEVLLAGQAAGKPEALVPRDYMLARMPSLHHTPMPSHGHAHQDPDTHPYTPPVFRLH